MYTVLKIKMKGCFGNSLEILRNLTVSGLWLLGSLIHVLLKKGAVVFEEGSSEGSPHHVDQTSERALALGAQTGEGLSKEQVQLTQMN